MQRAGFKVFLELVGLDVGQTPLYLGVGCDGAPCLPQKCRRRVVCPRASPMTPGRERAAALMQWRGPPAPLTTAVGLGRALCSGHRGARPGGGLCGVFLWILCRWMLAVLWAT